MLSLRVNEPQPGLEQLMIAMQLEPFNTEYTRSWAQLLRQRDSLDSTIGEMESRTNTDRAARFRLMHLYQAAGRIDEARTIEAELSRVDAR